MATFSFECAICLEEKSDLEQDVRNIEGDLICPECALTIPAMFEKALKNEIDYPPSWGGAAIDFEDFMDLFPPEFERAWYNKVVEYETPINKRLFCPHKLGSEASYDICNQFLGDCEVIKEKVARCVKCRGHVCVACRGPVDRPFYDHVCAAPREEKNLDPETKGKEWQRCPYTACAIAVELRDGCNAIVCSCGTEFCFICGEEIGDDHFVAGKPCPRFGTLENGIFDQPSRDAIAFPRVVALEDLTDEQFREILENLMRALIDGIGLEFDPELNDENEPVAREMIAQALEQLRELGLMDGLDDNENDNANLRVDPAFTVDEDDREFAGLSMDILDFLTISTQLQQEISEMTEDQQRVPQVLTDMTRLADDLVAQMWQLSDTWMVARFPGWRNVPHPVEEAVQITNFHVRHQRIADMINGTLPGALGVVGPRSVLVRFDGMAISQRYFELYQPRFARMVQDDLQEQRARHALGALQLGEGN